MSTNTLLLPAFLKLAGRRVLVVGGGPVAASKIGSLLEAGAQVTVVAPEIVDELDRLPITVARRAFVETDLNDVWFVVAAAPPSINRAVGEAAEARRIFVNAVDDPPAASAYAGGVVRRGSVTIAISTDGQAPALAGLLREALEVVLPDDLDQWMEQARVSRRQWLADRVPMAERRPLLLRALNQLYADRARDGQSVGHQSAAEP